MILRDSNVAELLSASPDAMVLVEDSGAIVFANRQVETMFGYAPDELLGLPVEVLIPEGQRDAHRQHRDAFDAQPRTREMGADLELHGLRRDGATFPVEISLSPVETSTGTLVAGAIRDVSDRIRIQDELAAARDEADRANRAKSMFLAAASHDLRQPLQTLTLLNAVLRKSPGDERARRAVEQQGHALDAMADLLNSLLDISKLESGAVKPDIGDCRVQDIFRRLQSEFVPQAEAKGLQLEVDDCSDVVRTDAGLFEQIVQNLVANAIRYTREGLVQLRCLHMSETVRIEVADTGMGIPRDRLDAIFDDFYRLEREQAGSGDGIGLGLSIVRRLTELLDHPLHVQSWPGKGSCFALTLPRGETGAAAPEARRPTCPDPAAPFRIMVIDDDLAVIRAATMLLESEGHDVTLAATADEATAIAAARGLPELIIADLHLGDGPDGLQAIARLRQMAGASIPAILVTGDTSSAVITDTADVPVCRVLSKPVDAEALITEIGGLAARSRSRTGS